MSDYSRRKAINFATRYTDNWDGYTATSPHQPTVTVVDDTTTDIIDIVGTMTVTPVSYLMVSPAEYDALFGTRVVGFKEQPKLLDRSFDRPQSEPSRMNRHQRRAKEAREKRRR